jgi:hypothetical protein
MYRLLIPNPHANTTTPGYLDPRTPITAAGAS